ncbi:hypothetical protein ACFV7R_03435 [Streptomyces sp. NPDC059866]|uniref:hypothetical protein n=1 Tax=Streptomyces sp. NPDC059866 TaxID=3346978 RepID=UPI00364DE9C0
MPTTVVEEGRMNEPWKSPLEAQAVHRSRVRGNILGARHGDVGLPHMWVERVEGRDRIAALADDLAAECAPSDPSDPF